MTAAITANPGRYKPKTVSRVLLNVNSDYFIKGIWPKEGIGCIFAPPGGAKSFMVLGMLGDISLNRGHWFGHRLCGQVPVTYVALEGAGGLPRRLMAYERVYGELPNTFRVIDQGQGIDIRKPQDRLDLIMDCIDAGQVAGVLVIDTLNQSAPGMDENSSVDMGLVIAAAKELQAALGGLVVLVSHTGKDATRGIRGHSSLLAALDSAIELKREGEIRTWRVVKSKDGDDSASGSFRLRVVKLYDDADGDPVTSCVIDPDSPAPAVSTKEMAAYEALRTMCKTAVPTIGEWREKCVELGVVAAKTQAASEKAIGRIKNALLTAGLIIPSGMRSGVYLPRPAASNDE